jgi:hypothetical protein
MSSVATKPGSALRCKHPQGSTRRLMDEPASE